MSGEHANLVAELIALFQRGAYGDVITAAARLRAALPHEPLIEVVAGAAHAERGEWEAAEARYSRALAIAPESVDAHYNLANALQRQGKLAAAEQSYRAVLASVPGHPQACNNLGAVLRSQLRPAEARTVLEHVLALHPGFVDALVNYGITLRDLLELDAARAALEQAVTLSPECADGWYNLGVVMADSRDLESAVGAFEKARDLRPAHRESTANLGQALANLGRPAEAVAAYQQGLRFAPDCPQILTALGLAWLDLDHAEQAIATWDQALANDPDYYRALGLKRFNQLSIGDWSTTSPLPDPPGRPGVTGSMGSPMSFIVLDDNPARQRRIAELCAAEAFPQVQRPSLPAAPRSSCSRLRIAYLSADFNNHPVAQLMVGVLAAHDRARFEVFAYAHSADPRDAMTDRIEASVDHFIDIAGMSDSAVASLAHSHRLDLAIDLTGHTRGGRTALLAHRIAPVQVAHLGYPGTIGASFVDYLVADANVIPPEQRQHYCESLLMLPGSFQPNDNSRALSTEPLSRAAFGLPDRTADGGGFVFCCFNNTYKIGPREWDVWMRLLASLPGSVLWLSRPGRQAQASFEHEALARGIDPARLVFAEKLDYAVHLARHRLADLFLDTFNYNAHTTASDALWGGLPVLTKAGRGFAARVATSVLHAVGLPELVTTSVADYEALALALARDPLRLGALRARLANELHTSALFDTQRYTRNLEQGFAMAAARHTAGLPPADLDVPDWQSPQLHGKLVGGEGLEPPTLSV